jgi:hypothetical protein
MKIAVLAVAALLVATPAVASDSWVSHRHGAWLTEGGLDIKGKPLCAANLMGQNGTMMFGIKFSGQGLFFQLWKRSWNLAAGKDVNVRMSVDGDTRTEYPMYTGRSDTVKGTFLEYTFNDHTDPDTGKTFIEDFLTRIAGGDNVVFSFPQGSETDWTGSLYGSSAALSDFSICVKALTGTSKDTQPYD